MSTVVPEAPEREWVSFEDAVEHRTWVFDVTFLTSRWSCIFGAGCQGVLTGPAPELVQGCCSYGAHFTEADDVERVLAAADTLDATDWQFRREGRSRGVVKKLRSGETVTRLVQGACVFLNRPEFEGGAGCALHRAALRRDVQPMDLKPNVCWQLPLRRDDRDDAEGHVTSTVTEWGRQHWGGGGEEFHWWCTEAPEAFIGADPVYRSMGAELIGLVGADVYARLVAYLEIKMSQRQLLPHPVVRKR
ncbi:MAG TPA: hypothetical protein VM121_10505 [Acidimicrobiales bacterium]|nr:hypothetical protein [Acidimicrobiales bacterium]